MKKLLFISVFCLAFAKGNFRMVHIFMIGDSTMANKPEEVIPETGWGQVLHYFFTDSIVVPGTDVAPKVFVMKDRGKR